MEKFSLGSENLDLRRRIAELERELADYRNGEVWTSGEEYSDAEPEEPVTRQEAPNDFEIPNKLELEEFRRYGRQMILSEVGLDG